MLKQLWHDHPRLFSAFLIAAALTLFFSIRIAASALYWSDPAHRNETVRPWMTVGYVARSWDLDPRELDTLAGLPIPEHGRPQPLAVIASDRGVPVADIIAEVEAAIATLRARQDQQ
jgi:hypothetical protein